MKLPADRTPQWKQGYKPAATITRSKLVPTPGKNYRLAWRWLYTVDYGRALPQLAGRQTASFDTLAAARRACVRNGFTPAVAWQ